MFTHLLVPLDGSKMAESALPAAASLAAACRASITLFHVLEKDAPSAVHGQQHLTTAADATAYLERVARTAFAPGTAVACHVHECAVDDVAASIVAHSAELHHDGIVMCSHGKGRALHLMLGSIAQEIIGLGSIPVLMTHPDEHGDAPPFSCACLLAPLDLDPEHAKALPLASALARAFGGVLHLVSAVPEFTSLSGQHAVTSRFSPGATGKMLDLAVHDAARYLEDQAAPLRQSGIPTEAHVLRGDPAQAIIEAALQLGAGCIILASHGKSGLEAFWQGSVAHKVCSLCGVPLLTVPLGRR